MLALLTGLNPKNTAYAGGAKGDGITDDTAALTAWASAVNASAAGANAVLPPGQYMCAAALPAITQPGVTITGAGYAQAANTKGSVITASATITGAFLTLAAEGITLRNLTIDGAGKASPVIAITGSQAVLSAMQARGVSSGGVLVDIQAGGATAWLADSVFNGINGANTQVQVNDTDLIMTGCKPKNGAFCVTLLSGAAGAQINGNHMTPGATNGQNCVYINGNPGRVQINGNRFDNYVRAAVQISATATGNTLQVNSNMFYSSAQADATWPLIGYDTTTAGYRGLAVNGNQSFALVTSRPLNFLAAMTQAGAAAASPTRISTLGSTVAGNSAYVSGAFYGTSASPLTSSANIVTTDGLTYTSVP